jgi:hypothetical protein
MANPISRFTMLDIVDVAGRLADPRAIVSMGGRYALANKRNASGDRREFACRAVNVSPSLFTLATPVNGALGERVITHFNEFGKLQGPIVRLLNRGFVFKVNATDEERSRLAAKIEWLEKNKKITNCRTSGVTSASSRKTLTRR